MQQVGVIRLPPRMYFPIPLELAPAGQLDLFELRPIMQSMGVLFEFEGLSIFGQVAGLALVSIIVMLVWLRGQRDSLRRQRAREAWLLAAWDSAEDENDGTGDSDQPKRLREVPHSAAAEPVAPVAPESIQATAVDLTRAGEVLEVLGGFAAGVASDFNDQLTTILGHVDLLMEQDVNAEDRELSLSEISKAAEEGRRSTHQLMAFSGSGIRRTGRHLLAPLLREHCQHVSLRYGVPVTVQSSPCAAAVEGNLDELCLILDALLNNAAEVSKSGAVVVRCEAAPQGDEDGGASTNVRISILDSGPGLQAGVGSEIFQPGYSTRPGGRGLGLPIALTLAARNGGRIVLRDAHANGIGIGGTLAELYLRRAHPASAPAPLAGPGAQKYTTDPVILVVEDEAQVLKLVTRVLEREGYVVLAASSAEDALGMIRDQTPSLLLTDVNLPGMDGLELADHIGEAHPGIPCIYTSGMVQDEELRTQLLGTMPHFLQKPFRTSELVSIVGRALAHGNSGPRQRVLVVDDEPTTRRRVRAIVEAEGFECIVAADGFEALRHLERARFNLVVTDIVMPGLDGIDLCRAISSSFPTVRIIAMSGNRAGRSGLDAATTLGAERVLVKPFSRDELSLAIRQVLGSPETDHGDDPELLAA
ncbi:MAG: two-component system cell cycle sensor histidine kinase/response regulator CckA [Planctomycetota bacterium]|jgi:two-component system cell cycle sensor histidine kinase/response regulator CckA